MINLFSVIALFAAAGVSEGITLQAKSEPMFRSGELQGCQLVFKTLFTDTVYRSGEKSVADGSLFVYGFNDPQLRIGYALKLVLNDIDKMGKVITNDSPPISAYFLIDASKSNKSSFVSSGESDEGGLLSVFRIDENFSTLILELGRTSKLQIVFNRRRDGSDIFLEIDLSEDNKNLPAQVVKSFTSCLESGFKEAERRMQSR